MSLIEHNALRLLASINEGSNKQWLQLSDIHDGDGITYGEVVDWCDKQKLIIVTDSTDDNICVTLSEKGLSYLADAR